MAARTSMASPIEEFSKSLVCAICQDRFTKPKFLECIHSFCQHCLVEKVKHGKKDNVLSCPLCRHKTKLSDKGVEGLKTNFYLVDSLECVSLQEKVAVPLNCIELLCEVCEESKEAKRRCLDCAQNICSDCTKRHRKTTATSEHAVETLEDIRKGKVTVKKKPEEDELRCSKHKGAVNRFYCKTCDELICTPCTVSGHLGHKYIEMSEAHETYKKSLQGSIEGFKQQMLQLQLSLKIARRAKRDLSREVEAAVGKIQQRADELINGIRSIQDEHDGAFGAYSKEVKELFERKNDTFNTAEKIAKDAAESVFLSVYPVIRNDVDFLCRLSAPRVDHRLWYLGFSAGDDEIADWLGKIQLQTAARRWKLYRELGPRGDGPSQFSFARGIDALGPNELVVADYENQGVVFCSIDGDSDWMTSIIQWGDAFDVAATGQIIVVVDSGVEVKILKREDSKEGYKDSGEILEFDETPLSLRSVAVKKDGVIVVGDIKKKVLTEHKSSNRKFLRTIPVKIEPYFLAVGRSDQVAISGLENEVKVIDSSDTELFSVRPKIGGESARVGTAGVCFDSQSDLYVVVVDSSTADADSRKADDDDYHNFYDDDIETDDNGGDGNDYHDFYDDDDDDDGDDGDGESPPPSPLFGDDGDDEKIRCHIHRYYGVDGTFLGCVIQDLHNPQGIVFTQDGRLAIADHYSVKIFHKV